MGDVFLQCLGEHQDVVQVYEDAVINDVMEDVIDEGLEDHGSIRQPERHHQVLVVLPLISLLYPDQVVCLLEVQLCKEACLLQRGEGGEDEWNGIAVFHRDGLACNSTTGIP